MADAATISPARPVPGAWLALGMLWFVYVLNFLDRQLLAILAKPIQDTLGVTDSQLGLIGGFYFACFYCFIAIPVGWLADKTNRVAILSAACAIWSAATVACGLSANYTQLVIARMTVGFGEAGGVPPSYAIISDYFPSGKRGTALGLYNLGPPVGAALGIAFGASIAAAFNWRYAFIALGAVGILAAVVLILIVREPRRGGLDVQPEATAAPAPKASFWGTAKMFFTRPTLLLMALGWLLKQKGKAVFTLFDKGFDLASLVMLLGGLFLIYKSVREIHHKLEGGDTHESTKNKKPLSFGQAIAQIMLIDAVFSFDSIITAGGTAKYVPIMIAAVVIAMTIMFLFSPAISSFIHKHPTLKMLALSFLVMIGLSLVIEGWDSERAHELHLKNYIYFGMAFSFIVEVLNMVMMKKAARKVVKLNEPQLEDENIDSDQAK